MERRAPSAPRRHRARGRRCALSGSDATGSSAIGTASNLHRGGAWYRTASTGESSSDEPRRLPWPGGFVMSITLLLVEPRAILRELLASVLGRERDIEIVSAATTCEEALTIATHAKPDVLLLDVDPSGRPPVAAIRQFQLAAPSMRIIVSGLMATDEIVTCLEAGANGYLVEDAGVDDLLDSIHAVHRGDAPRDPSLIPFLLARVSKLARNMPARDSRLSGRLTKRELEIIREVANGLSNKDIAVVLSIETQTVKNHIHNILEKLQLDNRLQAVEHARSTGLLECSCGRQESHTNWCSLDTPHLRRSGSPGRLSAHVLVPRSRPG